MSRDKTRKNCYFLLDDSCPGLWLELCPCRPGCWTDGLVTRWTWLASQSRLWRPPIPPLCRFWRGWVGKIVHRTDFASNPKKEGNMIMCLCGRWMIRKYVSAYGLCYHYDYCPYCEGRQPNGFDDFGNPIHYCYG